MEGIATRESANGAAGAEAPKLKRSMGLWMATALVIGNMVGSGIFLLPASLAAGLVVSSVLVSGLMLMNYTKGLVDAFTFIILLATLTTLVPYAYSAAAQAHLYFTERDLFERGRFARDTIVAALAFAYSVWAITGSGKDIIAKGFVLLLAGIPVYVLMKWWQAKQAEKQAAELVAAPAPVRSPGREGAVVAMKETRR